MARIEEGRSSVRRCSLSQPLGHGFKSCNLAETEKIYGGSCLQEHTLKMLVLCACGDMNRTSNLIITIVRLSTVI